MKPLFPPAAFDALAVLADAPPVAVYAAVALAWLALSRWLIRFL